jgi:GH15 family glucan-1,4-alpha-glucosidase
MPGRIEDYGLIGDLQAAALVDRGGSIDWLCLPRFDSGACFAALLGDERHGRWLIAPEGEIQARSRRYRPETLILETELETAEGAVRLIDFMPPRGAEPDVVRIVEGLRGRVRVRSELVLRFDYGSIVPWVRRIDDTRLAVAGPDAICFRTAAPTRGRNLTTVSECEVGAGDRIPFVLTWFPSHEPPPPEIDPEQALADTESFWREWSERCTFEGEWAQDVHRSLMILKSLVYSPTGGIVAAATTSLPEELGGERNWDYRFCWLRDATLTLLTFLEAGYVDEAEGWRRWLLRAVAGAPADLQIMYGVAGERRLPELELDWLPGYEGSRPVRIGNAASRQLQLDVYGEVADALFQARARGLADDPTSWSLLSVLLGHLEEAWREPDNGLWEMRGPRRHFTHSKVMAWVAFDRAVRAWEHRDVLPPARWRAIRDEIHREVCRRGFDPELGSFTQSYGSPELDASLLMIPIVGFLPATDPRVLGTIAAVRRGLERHGFVQRYRTEAGVDRLPGGEGVFLPCTAWLAEALALAGRVEEAREVLERLRSVRNDLGLLSEEYDPGTKRLLGNLPQAFSHLAFVDAVFALDQQAAPRSRGQA